MISIHQFFIKLVLLRVTVGCKSVPACSGQEAGQSQRWHLKTDWSSANWPESGGNYKQLSAKNKQKTWQPRSCKSNLLKRDTFDSYKKSVN